jgi:uncharacterized membrane protein
VTIHMILIQEKRRPFDFTMLVGWFLIYSFLGWIYETMYCSIKAGHFVSRGFLYGPMIPIYGICIVSAILLLAERGFSTISLFFLCAFIASAVEYLTSLWMEFVFGRRWWDYSNQLFNIDGRVCLGAAIVFGMSGAFILKFFHPNLVRYMDGNYQSGIPKKTTYVIFIMFLLDVIASFQKSLT